MFLLGFAVDCLAQVTWSYNLDDKNCDVFIQVNEGKNVLYLETMHIPGQYMTTSLWGTSATMCHINENDESYINGMKRNGSVTFLNNENQICFFENLGFSTGNMGGFYVQPWSYVYGVIIRVSCEDSSSIPLYCAKTEKMAQQVLLAREELECAEKDGNFEGGVYPFEMPNGETEYCVAGRCDVCNSKWYDDFVKHWKDSVCCDIRGKEPNANNGTCISPSSFDSTRVGVKHSRITAFPGCSKASAGEGNHFCKGPESSSTGSSSSEGSSSSGNSSSSGESSSSEASSSSATPMSSSSEEQENADCYAGDAEANAALYNADVECWSMQKESGYSLDGNGCLVGGCVDATSSDSMDDGDDNGESSSSEAESSSSEEDRCVDVSLKKVSGEEADPWVYVGKETYASRMVTYEKTTPNTGFFDALGRMYRQIKSRIKYYMGKETKVKKTVEIGEELDVWKRNFIDFSGNVAVSYIKRDHDWNIFVDSSIYFDGTYSVQEINNKKNHVRLRMPDGTEYYDIYDEFNNLKRIYSVSVKGDTLEERLDKYEHGIDFTFKEDANVLKKVSYGIAVESKMYNTQRLVLAKKTYACDEFGKNVDGAIPAMCEHPDKPSNDYFKDYLNPVEKLYYPGLKDSYIDEETWKRRTTSNATFGELRMKSPEFSFKCECIEKNQYIHTYNIESDKNPYVIIYDSNWEYNTKNNSWTRKCWRQDDMKKTYNHEMEHYRNREDYMKEIASIFFTKQIFPTKIECDETGKILEKYLKKSYFDFMKFDAGHKGDGHKYPVSPQPTSNNNREGREIPCSK